MLIYQRVTSTSIQHYANPKNPACLRSGSVSVKYADTPLRHVMPMAVFTPKKTRYISVQLMFNWCSSSTAVLGPCLDPVWRWSAQVHQPCQKLIPLHPEKTGETLVDRQKNHIWKHQLSQLVFVDLSAPDVDRMKGWAPVAAQTQSENCQHAIGA